MLKPSFTFLHPHCLQVPLSALRATFPKGDSTLPEPSRKQRMCVAPPSGSLLCQPQMRSQPPPRNLALATDARGVPSGEAVAPATEGASALITGPTRCKPSSFAYSSHLSPFAPPLPAASPFGPPGHFPQRGQHKKGPPKLLFGGPEALPWAIICCCSVRQRRYPGSWHIRRQGQRG